jgi:hypothetical protein
LRRNRQDNTTKDNQADAANGSSGGAPGTSDASVGAGSKPAVGKADQKMMVGMVHANISDIMVTKRKVQSGDEIARLSFFRRIRPHVRHTGRIG